MIPSTYDPVGPPHNPALLDLDTRYTRDVNSPVVRVQPVATKDPRAPRIEARPSVVERFYAMRRFGIQTVGRWDGLHGEIFGPGVELRQRVTLQEQMGNGTPFPNYDFIEPAQVSCLTTPAPIPVAPLPGQVTGP